VNSLNKLKTLPEAGLNWIMREIKESTSSHTDLYGVRMHWINRRWMHLVSMPSTGVR